MSITFFKYQGTGNDFIVVDNRQKLFDKNNTKRIALLCDRKFGIGADGLILLENHSTVDFKMVYFNADGNQSTMCGNGGRCIVAFAKFLNIIKSETTFEAIDGLHHAKINKELVQLQMQDVLNIKKEDSFTFLNTGSPHHVQLVEDVNTFDVFANGKKIRNSELYGAAGTNVNFVTKINDSEFAVRTYERGVENETLSCGTGVTAVAIAMHYTKNTNSKQVTLQTPGGKLLVSFNCDAEKYKNVWLTGPAILVFTGNIKI